METEEKRIIREKTEVLEDIKGATNLEHEYGERYKGWYLVKTAVKKEQISLGYRDSDLSYGFPICDYNFRFILPSVLEFDDGTLTYDEAQRQFGIFRFPISEDGKFCAPLKTSTADCMKLSEEDIKSLLGSKQVITFDAYKISRYGFQFFSLGEHNFNEIAKITDQKYASDFRDRFEKELVRKTEEVKKKISSSPNYLLILLNVLNHRLRDLKEVSVMTNNIIKMGI